MSEKGARRVARFATMSCNSGDNASDWARTGQVLAKTGQVRAMTGTQVAMTDHGMASRSGLGSGSWKRPKYVDLDTSNPSSEDLWDTRSYPISSNPNYVKRE